MSAAIKSSIRLKTKRRPGDPWVSKNRVLNGGAGKSKRNCPIYRNPNFDTDETKLLIQLWGDPKVQRELITTHKKHVVISQLSAKMEEYGYHRSPEEITTRIKNMKCFYNRLKKEMETTKNMDPSWRHYAEMDTIMMRPIFSVRPNEVPAPSLKYLLEQEQEKRKERKRKAEEEGSTISDSDEDIADILAVPNAASNAKMKANISKENAGTETSTEIESEGEENISTSKEKNTEKRRKLCDEDDLQNRNGQTISDTELAIKMEIESEEFQEYESFESAETIPKNSNSKITEQPIQTINISEDEELLVPKLEPIDVEEEYVNAEKSSTPTTKQNVTQLVNILKSGNIQSMPQSTLIKLAMPASSTPVAICSSSSSTQTQSKISVVSPTVLMSPQMSAKPTLATTDQRQVRLPGNLHALLTASGSRATVANGNGMKFLLVNTPDQRGAITTANFTSTIPLTSTNSANTVKHQPNVKIIQNTTQLQQQQKQRVSQQQQQQAKQLHESSQQKSSPLKSKEVVKRQECRELLKKRDLLGIKTALVRMVKLQEDGNEIQTERLAIERERLQYERTVADRFLNIMEQNQKIQQQLQQQLLHQQQLFQQQQQHIQIQQRSVTAPQVFATNSGQATVTSNGQIMLPPKLLITTMVPTSTAQAAAASTSKVLTTTSFSNLASTSNSDFQLVVPKEEPKN